MDAQPDGLLLHEPILWSLFPTHAGMRQYWRDFDALERGARSDPHRDWWRTFLHDSGGTGFWHETYLARGGMEAVFDDVAKPVGMARFAELRPARGGLFSARGRAEQPAAPDALQPAVPEEELT